MGLKLLFLYAASDFSRGQLRFEVGLAVLICGLI